MPAWSVFVVTTILGATGCTADPVARPPKQGAAADTSVQELLAKVQEQQQRTKGASDKQVWKARMECLVQLMKMGPAAVPDLIAFLKNEKTPPATRALAAEALGFLADDRARPALLQAIEDKDGSVQANAEKALGRLGRLETEPKLRKLLAQRDPESGSYFNLTFLLTRDDRPNPDPIRQALRNYDLARMDSAHLGKAAPDFTLADASGKTWRLDQFRGKKPVLLIFLIGIN